MIKKIKTYLSPYIAVLPLDGLTFTNIDSLRGHHAPNFDSSRQDANEPPMRLDSCRERVRRRMGWDGTEATTLGKELVGSILTVDG